MKRPRLVPLSILAFTAAILLVLSLSGCGPGESQEASNSSEPQSHALSVEPAPSSPQYRILHIMSYHSPWEWTDTQFEGFGDAFQDIDVEYKIFQMDAKNNSSEAWKEKVGKQARELIDSWKPDLVYTSDDEAQQYVAKYYVGTDIPFVFSAVNMSPEDYGFVGSPNVTGVLEVEHFVESAKLLKQIVPNATKVAVVIDDSPIWGPVVSRMKSKLDQIPDLQFVRWDKPLTFAEYQDRIREYQDTVDAIALIGIFNFRDENGQNVHYRDVLEWTAQNSSLPDFSFWTDRVTYGTLCVVSVSGYRQGLAAGRIARRILVDGESPASIPMAPTSKGEPLVSLARARELGIAIPSKILLTAQVITKYGWEN